jgi:hydantoinase/carbamoylase family amidase
MDADLGNADSARIAGMVREISKIGRDPRGGWTRLAFTPEEEAAHEQTGRWLEDLGLKVERDPVGNTFARKEGARSDLAPVVVGSHLDTVPQGGRFDGVAGVVAMVELFHLLDAADQMEHPLVGAVFRAEEGARFGEPSIGSKCLVGYLDDSDLHRLHDEEGTTAAEAMSSIGFHADRVADARWERTDAAAFLELHVEQGRILESNNAAVGLVDVISGSSRLRVDVTGRAGHSGANPMSLRSDALAAASQLVLAVESLAKDPFHRGVRTTVGWLRVMPNNPTTIPGRVAMMVDVRDVDSDRQREVSAEIVRRASEIAGARGVEIATESVSDTSPVVLSMWMREAMRDACTDTGTSFRVLTSGAGHDAQVIARLCPAGMIFVPSSGGISHNPDEWTSPEAIARGVDVLARSLFRIDGLLSSQWS